MSDSHRPELHKWTCVPKDSFITLHPAGKKHSRKGDLICFILMNKKHWLDTCYSFAWRPQKYFVHSLFICIFNRSTVIHKLYVPFYIYPHGYRKAVQLIQFYAKYWFYFLNSLFLLFPRYSHVLYYFLQYLSKYNSRCQHCWLVRSGRTLLGFQENSGCGKLTVSLQDVPAFIHFSHCIFIILAQENYS